jgi:hypothetical protein
MEKQVYVVEVYENGDRFWYQNDKPHRLDGPAVEFADGGREWYQNDKLHRLDGPAIEDVDGTKEYWIDDKKLTEAEFYARTKPACDGKEVMIDGKKYRLSSID